MGERVNGTRTAEVDLADQLPEPEALNSLYDPSLIAEQRTSCGDSGFSFDGYKRLRAWQVSMELVAESYRIATLLPDSERYGLFQQLRRAAVSVPLNIAEGWGRNSKAELARYSDIARGSLHEVDAALEVAILLKYMNRPEIENANSLFKRVGTMLLKLSKVLRKNNL
ncbi:MAG: four helix bundle protein [Fimbriimonadales bacterium]